MRAYALGRLRTISVIELLFLPLLLIPSASALAVVMMLNPIALVLFGAIYFVGMLIGGSFLSLIFAILRRPGKSLTPEWRKRIDIAITTTGMTNASDIAKRLGRAQLTDLTVGAFVHASFRAQIVASGGLLVQILRGTPSAQAVIAHEYAHIRHFDRIYFMILLIYGVNLVLAIPYFILEAGRSNELSGIIFAFLGWIWNLFATTIIVSKISVRREFAADFSAALIVGLQTYLDMLERATGRHAKHKAGFFHPSIEQRMEALITMQVSRPSRWLIVAYSFLIVNYLLQSLIDNNPAMQIAKAVYCTFGIVLELFRHTITEVLPEHG